jgi:hypothetical protein
LITDSIPRAKAKKQEYMLSDALRTLRLPPPGILHPHALYLQAALEKESQPEAEQACNTLAENVSRSFAVATPEVKVLGVRPHRVSEGICVYQKFGDYDLETSLIRLWMRTARLKKVTTFGALLNTLCHELCHHLDVVQLGFPNTPHTRGFFERTALLYHHVKNTPFKPVLWIEQSDGTFRFDWSRMMKRQ